MHYNISPVRKVKNYNIFANTISGILKEKSFKYISILFALYVTPIILSSNYYYHDDMARAMNGDSGWSRDGRPLAEIFSWIFSLGNALVIDIYPLPLLVSLFSLSLIFVLLYRRFGNNRPWLFSLCIFPILASPLFLDNLRWRFDSAFMVLSLAFALFPYITEEKNKLFFWIGSASLICTACLYQPALNVFIGAAALEGYYNLLVVKNITKSLRSIAVRIAQLASGLIIYIILIIPYLPLSDYCKSYSKTIPLNAEFFSKLFTNLLSALHIPNVLLQGNMRVIYATICISFLVTTFILLLKYFSEKKPTHLKKLGIIFLLALQGITIGIVALAGIIMFSERPGLEARVYLGWGMFLSFLLLPYCWITTRYSLILVFVPFLCAWTSFVMDFAASNASREEYKYRHNLALSIIKDLDLLQLNNQKLTISGMPPSAPTTHSLTTVFPFIRKLIERAYEMDFLLMHGSGRYDYAPKLSKEQAVEMEKLIPLYATIHYKFYKFNDAIVVRFPEKISKN